jgi:predicted phosphodiesterase
MYPLAVLSDIHGNSWALKVVLEDIDRRNIRNIVNLGDCVYGPLDPVGTLTILEKTNMTTICGNEDRIIFDASVDGKMSPTLRYVRGTLTQDHINWLKSRKPVQSIQEQILLFHGSPWNDQEYFLHTVQENGLRRKSQDEINRSLQENTESLYLCGHDHRPNMVQLSEEKLVVNPGSVGLQAYEDNRPFYHAVENRSPHARYCVITKENNEWSVEHISVPYDYISASEMAKRNHRMDWHAWLITGSVE